MGLSFDALPEEILHSILCYSDPSSSLALAQTGRKFRSATEDPILWRSYCQTYFRFWDRRHELPSKLASPAVSVGWKALYRKRYLIDQEVSRLLDGILETQAGRVERFQAVISIGYDVQDTLLRHILVDPGAEDFLARRYYASALLATLRRGVAVSEWASLKSRGTASLERALGAFDLFVSGDGYTDLDEISKALEEITAGLVAAVPDIANFTPRDKAVTVASRLRANGLTGINRGREYHRLEHNFLGVALADAEHNSLPLVSAVIYCSIAQRLGLDARPCGFPFHVHVIITPPAGFDMDGKRLDAGDEGSPIYMDPFRSDAETSVSVLRDHLNILGASDTDQTSLLGASSTSQVALRCAKNILNSVQYVYQFHGLQAVPVDVASARYAALWSSMILSGSSRTEELRLYLPWLLELFVAEFPWDVHLIEQYLVPLFLGMAEGFKILESLRLIRAADGAQRRVRRRTETSKDIRFRIGQVFQHRRYDYIAVITGWDTECGADEEWMSRMGIDRLPAGRHQSFYHVLVEDRSIRYVAEENIEVIAPSMSELPETLLTVAGKHFKRWDEETRTFVSNIRDEYPED